MSTVGFEPNLLDAVVAFSISIQMTSSLLTQGYRYHRLWKTFWVFLRSFSELLSKFGAISFQEFISKG